MTYLAPQFVTGAVIGCPTTGAGLGSSISQLTVSVWAVVSSSFSVGMTGTGFPPGGLVLQYGYGGGEPLAPGEIVYPDLTLTSRNHTGNLIYLREWFSPPTLYYDTFYTNGTRASAPELMHYLISINFTTITTQVYINDTLMSVTYDGTTASGSFDNTVGHWTASLTGADGVADLWMVPTALDISNVAVRRQFINADYSAVTLASDGTIAVGTDTVTPAVYLHTDGYQVGTPNNFLTNRGTGPNWTVSSGTLAWHNDWLVGPNTQINGVLLDVPTLSTPGYSITTNVNTPVSGTVVPTGLDYQTFTYAGTPATSFTISLNTAPSNGSAIVHEDGNYTYTPDQDFVGVDSFNYHATAFDGTVVFANGDVWVEVIAPYVQQRVNIGGEDFPYLIGTANQYFPSTFQYALASLWVQDAKSGMGEAGFNLLMCTEQSSTIDGFAIFANPDEIIVICGDGTDHGGALSGEHGNGYQYLGYQMFPYSLTADLTHIMVSIDSVSQIIQCYVNDTPLTADPATSEWAGSGPMASPGFEGLYQGYTDDGGTHGCVADVWASDTDAFTDLSLDVNQRLFSDSSGQPIEDFGLRSSEVVLTVPNRSTNPDDFLTNPAGYPFVRVPSAPLQFCATSPSPQLGMAQLTFTAQHIMPAVSLRWSDDRGETYGNAVTQTLGDIGEFATNLSWRRLGFGRDRVFALEWSAPGQVVLLGASILVKSSDS